MEPVFSSKVVEIAAGAFVKSFATEAGKGVYNALTKEDRENKGDCNSCKCCQCVCCNNCANRFSATEPLISEEENNLLKFLNEREEEKREEEELKREVEEREEKEKRRIFEERLINRLNERGASMSSLSETFAVPQEGKSSYLYTASGIETLCKTLSITCILASLVFLWGSLASQNTPNYSSPNSPSLSK